MTTSMSMFGSMRKSRSTANGARLSAVPGELDVFFLKQLAKEAKELDVERRLELEARMQEGTRRLLAAAGSNALQALQARKSLLASHRRLQACSDELHERRNRRIANRISPPAPLPSQGKVAVSEIRLPLMWRDHFKERGGDGRRFAVFCVLRVGADVHDTALAADVDRTTTDVVFDDVLLFPSVGPGFEVRLEVYAALVREELSLASAGTRLRKKISSSVSRAIGKRLSDSQCKDDMSFKNGNNGGNGNGDFELSATATLRLGDACARIATHELAMCEGARLPLFGHFCCRMAAKPKCVAGEAHSGYLSLVQQIGNITGSRRMLCSLKDFSLSMWSNFADVHSSNPDLVIPVKTGTVVTASGKNVPYPRFSFVARFPSPEEQDGTREVLLAADSPSQLTEWVQAIDQHIQDYEAWLPASESPMEIPSPGDCRGSHFARHRNSSLYDETFIDEDGGPRSTPPFCSWSSSSSSNSSSLELSHQARRSASFPMQLS